MGTMYIEMMDSSEIPVVAVLGATASGKHAVALRLAEKIPVELVSVDSMKIYRGMDIGTAKPTKEQRRQLHHHMLDLTDPNEPYTAARFGREARVVIREISGRERVPLLVGGSGMYLRAIFGWIFPGPEGDLGIRERLQAEASAQGVEALYARLVEIDPKKAETIHQRDLKRIVRALEVYEMTGITLSRHHAAHSRDASVFTDPLLLCLRWEREVLYRRINDRVRSMVDAGWLQEVNALRQKNFSPDLPALRALGYADLWRHLQGEIGLEETIEVIQRKTRQFAKRQMVWFRGMSDVDWIDVSDGSLSNAVGRMTKRIEAYLRRHHGVLHRV